MAAGSVDDIFVEIEVRLDRLETGMRRSEQIVNDSLERIEQRTSQGIFGDSFLSGTVQTVGKVAAGFATMLTIFGALNIATDVFQLAMAKAGEDAGRVADEIESIRERGNRVPILGLAALEVVAFIDNLANADSEAEKTLETLRQIEEATAALARQAFALRFGRDVAVQEKTLIALREQDKEKRIQLELEARLFEIELQRQRLIEQGITVLKARQFAEIEGERARLLAEERLRKLKGRRRDPTESVITALGQATFGVGGFSPPSALDPPTKQGQQQQLEKADRHNRLLERLEELVSQIGFQ